MKRKRFICSLLTPLLLLALASTTHAVPLTFNELDDYIETNENFGVQVWAGAADPTWGDLSSFGFNLSDGSLFSYNGFALGPGFDDGMGNVNGSSTHVEGFLNLSSSNAGLDTLLATLYFTAGSIAGTDSFNVSGEVNYFDGTGLLYLNFVDVDIDLSTSTIAINEAGTAPAPVPEPATLVLLGTGLAGIFGLRKKMRI